MSARSLLMLCIMGGVDLRCHISHTHHPASQPVALAHALRVSQNQPQALSDAAIAALIVQESRNAYYAKGHPRACPDDLMRNGHRCGRNSAYIRPDGAQPLCSAANVPPEMINQYRTRSLRKTHN
jgi:hypothetical protein